MVDVGEIVALADQGGDVEERGDVEDLKALFQDDLFERHSKERRKIGNGETTQVQFLDAG